LNPKQESGAWLFLLVNLPAKPSSDWVSVWRRLKKFGAVQFKTSTYLLPDEPVHYQGQTWLTRPRPEIDRVGSAWLIRHFIDPAAKFVFADSPAAFPDAIPYDMFQVELSHQGDACTFETLIERFGIRDRAVRRIAEVIHDADLEDDKFHRAEGFGLQQVFKGWAKRGLSDQAILARGFEAFDGLYAQFKKT
jgi:hypothetical protein